jgi:hypothetical protein
MSAFYARIGAGRVDLLTDAGSWRDDGRLAAIVDKVWKAETVPLAVTGRGRSGTLARVAQVIIDLADGLGKVDLAINMLQDGLSRVIDTEDDVRLNVVVAGISETAGPKIFYFTTAQEDTDDADLTPFTLHDMGSECRGGLDVTPAGLAMVGLTNAMIAADDFCAMHGAKLFEAGRRVLSEPKPYLPASIYPVAGRCDLTVIRAEGVTARTLHTWPDKIGEKVDPFAGQNVTPITASMNRQQRRAVEREERKGRAA